jgi:hypothetical protein
VKHLKSPTFAAIAIALGFAVMSVASAQTMDSQNQGKAPGSPSTGMNDPSTFSNWSTDYSRTHHGRISRQAYMDEAGRRWDAADKNRQGLTTAEIDHMYGSFGGNSKREGVTGGQ